MNQQKQAVMLPILCAQAPYGQDCCCCNRCGVAGCDLKVIPCGCCLHARCSPVSETQLLSFCPNCKQPSTGLLMIPIAFDEIDQATAEAAQTSLTNKRGKKRQNATVTRLNPSLQRATPLPPSNDDAPSIASDSNELRTGRWTAEETAFCDKLIHHFEQGTLPIPEKLKLNDFLSNMLKSKQSRLTKKMKNAKLSAKLYKRQIGYVLGDADAREFSQLESALFESMKCRMERAELRFHMQKVWRELFSSFCISIGQKVELDGWLRSVEEIERRSSHAMGAVRQAQRKAMIGCAIAEDSKNKEKGVMIDPNAFVDRSSQVVIDKNGDFAEMGSETDSLLGSISNKRLRTIAPTTIGNRTRAKSNSFVARVMQYLQQGQMPFEHVDVWAPCFGDNLDFVSGNHDKNRLTFAGSATAEFKLPPNDNKVVPLSSKEQYDLLSFGEYSQRFSFNVGCGMPGRVFVSGVASWEQGVKSAPHSLFERGGGAKQWGIETALGIPVLSPNVGRVVVVLYSVHDRARDEKLVGRITEELARLMPVPRWKLVVDVGADSAMSDSVPPNSCDARETDLRNLIQNMLVGTNMNPSLSQNMAGLIPLSQVLLKGERTSFENVMLQHALNSFEIYRRQGRSDSEIAWMTCRDFIVKEPELRKQHGIGSAHLPIAVGISQQSSSESCCPRPSIPDTNACDPSSTAAETPCYAAPTTSNCCPTNVLQCGTSSTIGTTVTTASLQYQSQACCPPQQSHNENTCLTQQAQGTESSAPRACCPPTQQPSPRTACCPPPQQQHEKHSPTTACCPPQQEQEIGSLGCSESASNIHQSNVGTSSWCPTNRTAANDSAISESHADLFNSEAGDFDHTSSDFGVTGSSDLGVSAMQLAQLLQSEAATGFQL